MTMTDPIADMIVRIKNALQVRYDKVDVPYSNIKLEVIKKLKEAGYIENYYKTEDGIKSFICVELKYTREGKPVIKNIKRASKPGLRLYTKKEEITKVLGGLGTVILTTSKGILTGTEAQKQNVGGEVICEVK
ncbi:MAG: 30S ribosomal protein S8 [Candidatus Ancaeobacter aquaticus]|nr:30S ribosomal protein S8 [Candidatus Ancaeobacter aquaticus]